MLSVPNLITISRIIISVILLFVAPFSMVFYLLYTLSGLSDVADGYVARKMKCTSRNGEILDSMADMVFIIVMFWIISPFIHWHSWIVFWVAAIVLIRVLSMAVRYEKCRKFASLHTVM